LRSDHFEIGETHTLLLAGHADRLASLLAIVPDLALNAIIALLGVGLLFFWRWTGGRELLLCSGVLMLYSIPAIYSDLSSVRILRPPWRLDMIASELLQAASMAITLEFIWAIYGLRTKALKYLAVAALLAFNGSELYMGLVTTEPHARLFFATRFVSVQLFDLIFIALSVWTCLTGKRNRLMAAALLLIPIASSLYYLGISTDFMIGPFQVSFFNLGFFLSSLALSVMLGQRAWLAWRARDELRIEFEAAREVQQQLIAPAVNVPGFRIESVYAPARQVGGDFFRIVPATDGSVLLVSGDVSGKGLKAAMTVSAIMGALRGCEAQNPVEVLAYLNRVLYGQVSGFVTCCATLISTDGAMLHANAGNPAPYRNGEELAVEAGLPLGIVAENDFAETRYTIAPGDRITFVSDGVVEATDANGELYGFARTQSISNLPAQSIADTARQFGQEDDITVLSVTRTAV
jgi:hypothetical protein